MFGEHESESPRVPSPWDSLISSPRSLSPSKLARQPNNNLTINSIPSSISPRQLSPSPILLPRLVPENDSGNVEYKLQLLNPSPSRFARLVTQLKWRLLEGGGQAYYELGVADSGHLVGLGREELESSLDTLEMMAGEIGASVIVVKEIEVPADLTARCEEDARTSGQFNSWGDARGTRSRRREKSLINSYPDDGDSVGTSTHANTETEEESGATDDCNHEDMQMTVIVEGVVHSRYDMTDLTEAMAVFSMDSELESDAAETTDISEVDEDRLTLPPSQYAVDLEISSVYKPRPMRKRFHHFHPGHQHHHSSGQKHSSGGKSGKKSGEKMHPHHGQQGKKEPSDGNLSVPTNKSHTRRQARDRRRDERKQTLLALASRGLAEPSDVPAGETQKRVQAGAVALVEELEALRAEVGPIISISRGGESIASSLTSQVTDSTITAATAEMTVVTTSDGTGGCKSPGAPDPDEDEDDGILFISPSVTNPTFVDAENSKADIRLIVEVLVVRKMSMEEGFLDFEGFSFI